MLGVNMETLGPRSGAPEIGVGVGTGVEVGVGVGVGVDEVPPSTSMPLTCALSVTVTNWIVTAPLLLAVVLNCSTTALYSPPAVAKMSKFVNTCTPFITTLKTRLPAAVQYSSAKCSRTVYAPPAVSPGIVYVKLP